MSEGEHSGRVAIVTGASSGIGRAAAIALAAQGATVLAVARSVDKLVTLAHEVTGIVPLAQSIETPEGCARAVDTARKLGPPLILVNNAGLGGYLDKPIFEHRTEDWRTMMAVNLDAPFELTRLVSHDIRKAGFGRIVTISSTAGEVGAPSMSAYCASKHGVIGLMRAVAHDLAPFGATANAVLPSWVKTEMAERDAEREARERNVAVAAVWAERTKGNPAGRLVTVEEVADLVSYLASTRASAINGEAVTISIGASW